VCTWSGLTVACVYLSCIFQGTLVLHRQKGNCCLRARPLWPALRERTTLIGYTHLYRLLWKDKSCPAFTYLIMKLEGMNIMFILATLLLLSGMVQVQTLATLKDWEGLEALAKEKKNVLPIPVYIAACKSNGAPTQATARYPSLVPWSCDAESPHVICCARSRTNCIALINSSRN